MLHIILLCCAVLCCAVLCCAVLCCAVLRYAMLYCTDFAVLHCMSHYLSQFPAQLTWPLPCLVLSSFLLSSFSWLSPRKHLTHTDVMWWPFSLLSLRVLKTIARPGWILYGSSKTSQIFSTNYYFSFPYFFDITMNQYVQATMTSVPEKFTLLSFCEIRVSCLGLRSFSYFTKLFVLHSESKKISL